MIQMTNVVKQLLIINIIFFIASYIMPNANDLFALHYFESDKFRFWQPITHMFMHGGPGHIFFNMFALVSFGISLEQIWGEKKFLFFYISCGLGAALLHSTINYFEIHSILNQLDGASLSQMDIHTILNTNMRSGNSFTGELLYSNAKSIFDKNAVNPENFSILFNAAAKTQTIAVGASGAVYGLLVAFAFLFPNAELALLFIPVPIKAKYFVPGILAIDLFLGLKGSSIFGSGGTGIAHFAHIGGAICGFLMMWFWKKNQFDKNRWDKR